MALFILQVIKKQIKIFWKTLKKKIIINDKHCKTFHFNSVFFLNIIQNECDMNNLQDWRYVQGERHARQMSGTVQLKVKKTADIHIYSKKLKK